MKRIILILFAIGITAMSSVSMAAMSNSRVRKETRFLTDKMAYELNLNTAQYNDVYEINFDFIYSIRYLMDDVIRGYEWALDDYYNYLDVRNDDLRWVLSDAQYRRFLQPIISIVRSMQVVADGISVSTLLIPIVTISIFRNPTIIVAIREDTTGRIFTM